MSASGDWFEYLHKEDQVEIESLKDSVSSLGQFIEYQAQQESKLRGQANKLLSIVLKLVQVEGWGDEPFEEWPKGWPIDGDQGGCVLCGGCPKRSPFDQPELKDHRTDCAYRLGYEFLKEIKQ